MKVLVACEESQTIATEFRKLGHEAYSCDLIDCSGGHPEYHIKADAAEIIKIKWDLIIAHPPCTYMSKAGARWMFSGGQLNKERFEKCQNAKKFFEIFLNADCPKICVENPTPLKIVGLSNPTQVIQPYEYGDPFSKRTCLWLKGLSPLKPTNILTDFVPYLPSNTSQFAKGRGGSRGVAHNAKQASKTFIGIAKAMAEQWGGNNNE